MDKFVKFFGVGSGAFAIVYAFTERIFISSVVTISLMIFTFLGYKLENYIKDNGNDMLNRIVYLFTKKDEDYIILNKCATYTYLGNDTYTFCRKYEICPTKSDLDRMGSHFNWSASSAGAKIAPTESNHKINSTWQQESWTCYTVYFNEVCPKNKPYHAGSQISNLVDSTHSAVPYLSNNIERKTKSAVMEVILPRGSHPQTAKFQVFSPKSSLNANHEETLEYDGDIGGFKRIIHFPRKGWRYVISW